MIGLFSIILQLACLFPLFAAHCHPAPGTAADVYSASSIWQQDERHPRSGLLFCCISGMVSNHIKLTFSVSSSLLRLAHSSPLLSLTECYDTFTTFWKSRTILHPHHRVLWVHHAAGIWVYPIMERLSPVGLVIFLGVACITLAPLYLLGEKLNHKIWKSTAVSAGGTALWLYDRKGK